MSIRELLAPRAPVHADLDPVMGHITLSAECFYEARRKITHNISFLVFRILGNPRFKHDAHGIHT